MRIGGIEFVRSGEGLSPRGCPEFLVCDAGWDVGGTMDGVLSGGAGGGRYVARQEAVPWWMDADECAGVWGCGVSAGGWLAGGNGSGGLREDGSDGRGGFSGECRRRGGWHSDCGFVGTVFSFDSGWEEEGGDGTPRHLKGRDGRDGTSRHPSPMGSGTELQ